MPILRGELNYCPAYHVFSKILLAIGVVSLIIILGVRILFRIEDKLQHRYHFFKSQSLLPRIVLGVIVLRVKENYKL